MKNVFFVLLIIVSLCACQATSPTNIVMPYTAPVASSGKITVWMHGYVKNTGPIQLMKGHTVSQAIALAGGIKEDGRGTVLHRRFIKTDQQIRVVDTEVALVTYHGGYADIILENGDAIYVDCWGRAWYSVGLSWFTWTVAQAVSK